MNIATFVNQFFKGVDSFKEAYSFSKENRIWAGLLEKKWISAVVGFVVIIVAIHSISTVLGYFTGTLTTEDGSISQMGMFSGLGLLTKELFFGSSIKYIVLILLEVVIFHCSVKSLSILTNSTDYPTFKEFYKAEFRMIKVAFRSWVYELLFTVLITTVFSIIGLEFIKYPFIYLIQFYFVGLAFMDNYFEQFGISTKNASAMIYEHAGASIAIGLLSFMLVIIPIVGPVVGPILGAVAATLYLFHEDVALD